MRCGLCMFRQFACRWSVADKTGPNVGGIRDPQVRLAGIHVLLRVAAHSRELRWGVRGEAPGPVPNVSCCRQPALRALRFAAEPSDPVVAHFKNNLATSSSLYLSATSAGGPGVDNDTSHRSTGNEYILRAMSTGLLALDRLNGGDRVTFDGSALTVASNKVVDAPDATLDAIAVAAWAEVRAGLPNTTFVQESWIAGPWSGVPPSLDELSLDSPLLRFSRMKCSGQGGVWVAPFEYQWRSAPNDPRLDNLTQTLQCPTAALGIVLRSRHNEVAGDVHLTASVRIEVAQVSPDSYEVIASHDWEQVVSHQGGSTRGGRTFSGSELNYTGGDLMIKVVGLYSVACTEGLTGGATVSFGYAQPVLDFTSCPNL